MAHNELKNKIEYCKGCKYCIWLVGLGQGVRCSHEKNQHYLLSNQSSPVLVGNIPTGCQHKELRENT